MFMKGRRKFIVPYNENAIKGTEQREFHELRKQLSRAQKQESELKVLNAKRKFAVNCGRQPAKQSRKLLLSLLT